MTLHARYVSSLIYSVQVNAYADGIVMTLWNSNYLLAFCLFSDSTLNTAALAVSNMMFTNTFENNSMNSINNNIII